MNRVSYSRDEKDFRSESRFSARREREIGVENPIAKRKEITMSRPHRKIKNSK